MIVSEIFEEIRDECNTNDVKVPDSYLLTGVNLDYGEIVMDIFRVKTDFNFQAEESYTDFLDSSALVAGDTGYNGEYPFPTDLLKPIRVEISYDGTNWRPAKFYDLADNWRESETAGADNVGSSVEYPNYSETKPFVRFERDSFFVRPLNEDATVTGGIHIWYEKRQDALTASDTPLFEANYHRLLVLKGALRIMRKFKKDYKISDRNELRGEINDLRERMLQFYQTRFKKSFVIRPTLENMR